MKQMIKKIALSMFLIMLGLKIFAQTDEAYFIESPKFGFVRLRDGACTSSREIAQLKHSQEVIVISKNYSACADGLVFWRVKVNNTIGYVASIYLRPKYNGNILSYWGNGDAINDQLAVKLNNLFGAAFRPKDVAALFRDAAQRIGAINRNNIDPIVIENINEKVEYYNEVARITENAGENSICGFLAGVASRVFENSISFKNCKKYIPGENSPLYSQDEYKAIKKMLDAVIYSEKETIRKIRQKYGIELVPW